jgi:uncharacterized protein
MVIRDSSVQAYEIEVTKKCNLRCSYCYLGEVKDSYDMSEESAQHIVDAISNNIMSETTNVFISFWGGEPLLNFKIIRFFIEKLNEIQKAKKAAFHYQIITNGTILNAEIMEFTNRNNISIQISLDGTKEFHDACRVKKDGTGSFDDINKNVHELLRSRKEYKDKSITLCATISNKTNNLSETIDFFSSLDIPFLISPVSSRNEWREKGLLAPREIEKLFTPLIQKFEKEANIGFVNKNNLIVFHALKNIFHKEKLDRKCGAGINFYCFSADGNIYLCHRFISKPNYSIGTTYPYTFHHDRAESQNIKTEYIKKCKSCVLRYWCLGTCPYDSVISGKKYDIDPIMCSYSKMLYVNVLRIVKDLYVYKNATYELFTENFKRINNYSSAKSLFEPIQRDYDMGAISLSKKLIASSNVGIVELGNEGILYLKNNEEEKYIANVTTMAILDLLDGHRTAQEITQEIANVCEVEFETIKDDIYGQLAAFQELGLVEEVAAASHA